MKRPIKRPPAKTQRYKYGRYGRLLPTNYIGPGCMCEYGWYDTDVEDGINTIMRLRGVDRHDALIEYFNNV
jgi:hypothetical protein